MDNIINTSGAEESRIDPSTEAKQDDAIDELQDIEIDTEAVVAAVEAVEVDVEATNVALGTIEEDIEAGNTLSTNSLSTKSTGGGSQRVTLAVGVGQGSAQACKFCRIQCYSTNTAAVRVRIGSAVEDATTGVELPGNPVLMPYSVNNLNLLYFYSTDANAIVDIEYFD